MILTTSHRSEDDRPRLLQTSSTDVDEHCADLGGWQLTYDQISAGGFRGSFTQLSLPQLDIFHEVTSQQVRQSGQLGHGCFGLAVPCRGDGPLHVNGTAVPQDALILSFDADVDICTPRGSELRGVTVSARQIEDIASQLAIELPHDLKHRMRALAVHPEALRRFRDLLATIDAMAHEHGDGIRQSAICEAQQNALLIEIADMLPSARPCDDISSGGAARKRIVDRACEMMLTATDEPVSMLDICKAVGASRRKLSYCFQDVLGTSPITYWRAVRLNRVRRDLKSDRDPRDGIYDIAVRHGFWHFSQFSLDYKRHFAELPSETLRRARMDGSRQLRHNSAHH